MSNTPDTTHRADMAKIHIAIKECGMSTDDHRALLVQLFGVNSSAALTPAQRSQYIKHLTKLGYKPKAPASAATDEQKRKASPLERKVWAMWGALGRSGKLNNPTPAGLRSFVERQTGCSDIRFCNQQQLHTLVETLKMWGGR
jgi:phage gp16-like protein